MKPVDQSQQSFSDYVLARMTPEVANSFTALQYAALREALVPRRHPVNLRLSIPLGWTQIYLVVLAGRESRSPLRRQMDTVHHPIWTPMNLVVIVAAMGISGLALLSAMQWGHMSLGNWLNPQAAPAAIPFKGDQASCEQSGRVWQEDRCLDFAHDPTF